MPIIEPIHYSDVKQASKLFHRDGFVLVKDTLTPEQLRYVQAGSERRAAQQMKLYPQGTRGKARWSFGSQIEQPEWAMLIDLPTVLPILDTIFNDSTYVCSSCSGDFNMPGAKAQVLHLDIGDNIYDPLGIVTLNDLPTPWVVVNYFMCDINEDNAPMRMIPHTHRFRHAPPSRDAETQSMKESTICGAAGTTLIRDVRAWHGGTDNNSDQIRIMVDVGYFAPWYRIHWLGGGTRLPRELYNSMSDRGKEIARYVVEAE